MTKFDRDVRAIGAALVRKDALVTDLVSALTDAEVLLTQNIYPKPDVGPDHPYSILLRVRAAIEKAHGWEQP